MEAVLRSLRFPLFTVDAFTRAPFSGNPAAVVFLEEDSAIDDHRKQLIAAEMRHSETAFVSKRNTLDEFEKSSCFNLRWFTPKNEVPLCGHATLATAAAIFAEWGNASRELQFHTKSGVLKALREPNGTVVLDLPARSSVAVQQEDYRNLLDTVEPEEQLISEERRVNLHSKQSIADVQQIAEVQDSKKVQNAADPVSAAYADCGSTDVIMQERCSRLCAAEMKGKDKEKKERKVQMKQEIYGAPTERDLDKKGIQAPWYVEHCSGGVSVRHCGKNLVNARKPRNVTPSDEKLVTFATAMTTTPANANGRSLTTPLFSPIRHAANFKAALKTMRSPVSKGHTLV
ncbi:hypothetical protein MTO96_005824 [Rhipicephalus appendiculatus]